MEDVYGTYNVPATELLREFLLDDESQEHNLARPKSAILGLYFKSTKMLLALISL